MKKRLVAFLSFLICLGSLAQFNVAARAGGGGGGGGGGHSHSSGGGKGLNPAVVLGIAVFFGFAIRGASSMLNKRAKRKIDASGLDYKLIKKEISDAYFAIQKAWTNGDMTPAKGYMTQRLFENHQKKLAKMAKANKRNVCEDIQLLSVTPFKFSKNGVEKICVEIKGSMIDYIAKIPKKNESDNFVAKSLKGIRKMAEYGSSKRYTPKYFKEFWTFIKNSQGHWQLDRITCCDDT